MAKYTTPPEQYTPNWISQLDGRYQVAQEIRQRYRRYTDDLGGESVLSYAQLSLVSHALFLQHWLHLQEKALATGQDIDMGRYTQALNSLQGLMQKLGMERKAKDVPSLSDYLSKREASA